MALRSLNRTLSNMSELVYYFTYKYQGKPCSCSSPTYELALKEHIHALSHKELFTDVSEIQVRALDL